MIIDLKVFAVLQHILHTAYSPHGVKQSAVILNTQELIRHGHVVCHRFLPIMKESVWSPDFAGHQVVETEDVHWSLKLQPLVFPALPEEHIYRVFLFKKARKQRNVMFLSVAKVLLSVNVSSAQLVSENFFYTETKAFSSSSLKRIEISM